MGVGRGPGYANFDLMLGKRVEIGGPRYAEFRVEAFNVLESSQLRRPRPRHRGTGDVWGHHDTVSSPRVIELVLKFYF
ncbi:MAG: hypothetical protein H0W18_16190 [Acidobacteria bacterium]|nr:hypothetical protein [Acidobacteriota bacterium]